jgi:hypothetical protein
MMTRPEMYLHKRADVRLRVRARAMLRSAGAVAACEVRNLSAGGIEVSGTARVPGVGERVEIKLFAHGIELGPLAAETVRRTDHGVAFKFLHPDPGARRRVVEAIARM